VYESERGLPTRSKIKHQDAALQTELCMNVFPKYVTYEDELKEYNSKVLL
jgi:hypothetical protein